MSLRDAVAALVQAAPPDATIPVRWLAEQLEHDATPTTERDALDVDMTVAQVAARFDRGASTIRTWCENGQLPGSYRLNGREWRIPLNAVQSLQRTAAASRVPAKPTDLPKATDLGAWRAHVPGRHADA